VLYTFCSEPNCADGFGPSGSLVLDAQGNLYGTTQNGGARQNGTAFKITPSGTETVVHNFAGGVGECYNGLPGCGVVFKVTP
jgi:uncharacterized repeat protein (TIGR03803 family)